MDRRGFLKTSATGLAGLAITSCSGGGSSMDSTLNVSLNTGVFSRTYAIPPEASFNVIGGVKTFDLSMQTGQKQFTGQGTTATMGINGSFLAPTLRMTKGENVALNVFNALGQETSLHWHGMRVPSHMDGSPHQVIAPNATWNAAYAVVQRASTNWYHPHVHGTTAKQVYAGLAGMLIVDDAETLALDLPKTYGVDDIPVVAQDRDMAADGSFIYSPSSQDVMSGYQGSTHLINGVIDSVLDVPAKEVRFRLLNGSNARIYQFSFSGGISFKQIAGDQSLLPAPVSMSSITMSPGERAEIIVDLTNLQGSSLTMVDNNSGVSLFQLNVVQSTIPATITPTALTTLPLLSSTQAVRIRPFVLSMSMGRFYINGQSMDMAVINETVALNDIEIWDIQNTSNMTHNFHVHGAYFTVLSRNGATPLAHESGYKDTIYLPANARIQVLIQFTNYTADAANPFMYHCHILEHEDAGMMGQLTVV